ncbi:cation diffusion facilitator [Pseudohyphozyma bogoriensis]|nr:cation diffusion facilitator [Pseudohyphozyma bogoriensis]
MGHRAAFTTEGSSVSRSTSRERDNVDDRRRAAGQRTGSFSATTGAPDVRIHIPRISEEGPYSAEPDDTDTDADENDAFLSRSALSQSTPKAMRRNSSAYGTFQTPPARYLQLNGATGPESGAAALKRNESVFRMAGMINNEGGKYEHYRKTDEDLAGIKNKKVRDFYENQNEILDGFAEVDEILECTTVSLQTGELAPMVPTKPSTSADREEAHANIVKFAINLNFALNFFLLGGKVFILIFSNSMSLLASTVDSAMDFLSTLIIFGTSKIIEHKSWKSSYLYPTGKKRMEPMGITVFAVFMIASFVQVFIESVERLFDKNLETAQIPLVGKIVMLVTIVLKLGVWLWGRTIKNSSVEALTQDAENDIVFNTFSLIFPFVGEQMGWKYLDPLGGALLSLYIIVEWTETLLENVTKLSGKRATPGAHQRIAYLLTRFSPLIIGIQHLSVYHTGDSYVVETDIIVPSSTPLVTSHNVGESTQYGIEQLEGVERAYVHIDVTANPLSGHIER